MARTILHVDMDAFYASVEQRDHPALRGKPLIVGSDPKGGKGRGIVATCSYEARKFGVHSAQPISQAWRMCPHGIYVEPNMPKYVRASECVMRVLLDFSDLVEQVSIDEAFLDVTGSRRLFGDGASIARTIKDRIRSEQRLTASVGVAASKFVAKVASDLQKPDGLVVVDPGREAEFLAPLPVSRLWGVGQKTTALLKDLGVERICQIAALERRYLVDRFGKGGEHLWELSRGIDGRPVAPEEGYKSIGHETTFEKDTEDERLLHDTLLWLAEKVAQRLRANNARARTIAIKFREADFSTYTRRKTLSVAVDTSEKVFPQAWNMMRRLIRRGVAVRLIGVYGSNLESEEAGQLSLFDKPEQKDRRLATAVDHITRRYGDSAITRATLVGPRSRQTLNGPTRSIPK
jgi:DNA polymerase IV